MKKFRERLSKFFFPGPYAPRWALILPYVVLGALTLLVIAGGVYG